MCPSLCRCAAVQTTHALGINCRGAVPSHRTGWETKDLTNLIVNELPDNAQYKDDEPIGMVSQSLAGDAGVC